MSIFRELFGFAKNEQKDGKSQQQIEKTPEILDNQPRNPYTRLCILAGHSDLVTILIAIDERRIFTAGQDGIGIIWDCKLKKKLFELTGHNRHISCATVLEDNLTVDNLNGLEEERHGKILLTASYDNTIRLWDLDSGMCIRVITDHTKTIQCFTFLHNRKFYCSGGDSLCIWNQHMRLKYTYKHISPDCIKFLLPIRGEKVVAATDKSTLSVYNILIEDNKRVQVNVCAKLSSHRESITSLIKVSDSLFASSSHDGTINIWTAFQIEEFRQFNFHEVYEDKVNRMALHHVHAMITIEERYVAAATGNGFAIYDVFQGRCIVNQPSAHHSDITCLALIKNGFDSIENTIEDIVRVTTIDRWLLYREIHVADDTYIDLKEFLVTASNDSSIRLWASPVLQINPSDTEIKGVSPMTLLLGQRVTEASNSPLSLQLVGECMAHSRGVQHLAYCGPEGLASCGLDGLVILWKDGTIEAERFNYAVREVIARRGIFSC